MTTIPNDSEHPDNLQLKQLLEEAKPLMLPMFPDRQKVWVAESPPRPGDQVDSREAPPNITPRSALQSAQFSLNPRDKPYSRHEGSRGVRSFLDRAYGKDRTPESGLTRFYEDFEGRAA